MKENRQRRGSVLMEFIIVFPIYLVLFAGTVLIGDMLIHSNRLVSADRVAAYRVDGRDSLAWQLVAQNAFHPGVEVADDGTNQDWLSPSNTAHYADATGPWSVCALASAHDAYKPLAGGTLGQLLAARMLLGGGSTNILDRLADGVGMVSKDTRNGASFYTLKRRNLTSDWRDRNYVSRLLRTQNGRSGYENWRLEVADEGWHTADTINGRSVIATCTEAHGEQIDSYNRYSAFEALSE